MHSHIVSQMCIKSVRYLECTGMYNIYLYGLLAIGMSLMYATIELWLANTFAIYEINSNETDLNILKLKYTLHSLAYDLSFIIKVCLIHFHFDGDEIAISEY